MLFVAGLATHDARAAAPLTWLAAGALGDTPSHGLTAVDCPSASVCIATENGGGVLATTAPLSAEAWGAAARFESLGRLNAISCPAAPRCFVVDALGNLDSGSTLGPAPAWSSWNIGLITPLNGISCPSTSLCVAVDAAGRVLASTTPAAPLTWSLPMPVDSPNRLNAISCPSARLCVAVDSAGNALVSADPTSIGAWRVVPLARTGSLSSVSCTSAGLCVVAARSGSVYATAAVASAPVTWSATTIDSGVLSAVSCSDVGLCLALDQSGNAFESDNPASTRPVWTRAPIDTAERPSGASCRPVVFCVVVDGDGNALAAALPGPSALTGGAAVASQTAAQITATVDPNDANVAGCRFQYGRTTAYGRHVACSPIPRATDGSQAVAASLRGLSAATTYHFRITATTGVASTSGADAVFATPPPLRASPSLAGTPAVGSVLTCNANIPTATTPIPPPTAVAYAWLADTTPIAGATAATHLVSAADVGHHLSCQVSVSGDGAVTTAASGFDDIPAQAAVAITETRVAAATHRSTRVSVSVTCSPQAALSCTLSLQLTAVRRVRYLNMTITVGTAQATLAPGATQTLTAWLNDEGKRLLKERRRLAVTVTVTGTVVGTLIATLRDERFVLGPPQRIRQHLRW